MYNQDYYEKMVKQNSGSAQDISKIRWDFVSELNPKTILDFGCGPSYFSSFKPDGVIVNTFDVMPVMQTGIRLKQYDLMTMWDVFEHIDDHSLLLSVR